MSEIIDENTPEAKDSLTQFVTFQVAGEHFALAMAGVQEIIRLPQTVEVPLTPGSLTGLANLRGMVLPILDLRALLGLEARPADESTRVVVADLGQPVGLVVDKVNRVISADDDVIESVEGHAILNKDAVNSVIRHDTGLVQLLNIDGLLTDEFQALERVTQQDVSELSPAEASDTDEELELDQLVSFLVDGQEYAFDLMDVEGTLRVPESITQVPRAQHHVLGLMELRGRLVPLVSLRRMFAMSDVAPTEQHRVLLVNLPGESGQTQSIGLVVDQVREVLRVSHADQDNMPQMLNAGDDEIRKICRLDGGKRLVSVIETQALLGHPAIAQAIEVSDNEPADQEAIVINNEDSAQLVVFNLGNQEYSVSIESVQEITRVPSKMDRVPKTADFIDGMVNLRGSVLPVLDMRTRFGLERMERADRQRILVLNVEGTRTGFIVDSVAEVLRLSGEDIEPAPRLSDDQAKVLHSIVNLKDSGRMIQVVEAAHLLSDSEIETLDGEAA